MSYNLSGFKWGSSAEGTSGGVITWSADFSDQLNHSGSYSDGQFDAALQGAFDRWEQVASVDFQYVASGGTLQIGAGDLDGFGTDVVGVARYTPVGRSGYDAISAPSIDFDTTGISWSPTGGSGVNFYAVALHEIGHILGLDHPAPDDPSEIMNQYISTNALGDGDMNGIQRLYGTDPGDEIAPPSSGGEGGGDGGGGSVASSDDGGGGGGGGAIIGLLALVLGFLFGGVGAGAALAVGRVSDDDDDATTSDDILLSDLIPTVDDHDHEGEHVHEVYWAGESDALPVLL